MPVRKDNKTFGYYFLNRHLHPKTPKGFRRTIVHFIINKNKSENVNKVLLVSEKSGFWNYPKESITAENMLEDIFTTITKNLDNELGFRGVVATETKPSFQMVATFYDFYTQIYDSERSKWEQGKGLPLKGKIYTIFYIYYKGPDDLPMNSKSEVSNFHWVNYKDGLELIEKNTSLISFKNGFFSKHSVESNKILFKKAWSAYTKIKDILEEKQQTALFTDQ